MPNKPKDFIDWSKTPIKRPPHELSEPVEKAKGGQAIVDQFAQLVRKQLGQHDPGPNMRQPNKEEELRFVRSLFPNLPETQEELMKQNNWEDGENPINQFLRDVQKPITRSNLPKNDLGRGPVNNEMSEEEKRKAMTDEEWRLHKIEVRESDS